MRTPTAPAMLRTMAALIAAAVLAGCSRSQLPPPSVPAPGPASVEGVASWYGPGFHGRRTTSGEIYDQHDLTAAHPTLPLGSRVAVTNLENERVVEVRINDRGPFVGGRMIDLSYAAASMLDMIEPGTAPVRIELLGTEFSVFPRARYEVQVGAFSDRRRAVDLHMHLLSKFDNVHLTTKESPNGTYCRVRIGPYEQREEAVSTARDVSTLGFPALIVEEEGPTQ